MANEALELSFNLEGVRAAAREFWQWAQGARVFTFSGTLGAGKTTFIHALCDELGVKDAVSSPTFALINEYEFAREGQRQVIYHMDWYRMRDANEAVDAGMEDALANDAAICFVEWPERARELLNIPHVQVSLEQLSEYERILMATNKL